MDKDYKYVLKPVIIIFVLAIVAAIATTLIDYTIDEKKNKEQIENTRKIENVVEIPDNIVPNNTTVENIIEPKKDNNELNMNVQVQEDKTKEEKNKTVNLNSIMQNQLESA